MHNRLLIFYSLIFSQNLGDFLSKSTVPPSSPFVGEWTNSSSWLKWDGTTYINANEYPGQTISSANANVIIAANSEITFNPLPNNININVKNVTVQGKLILIKDLNLPTTNNFYIDKGLVLFDKFVKLILPVGASLSLNIDNVTTQGLQPKDGNPDCNGNTAVVIGGVYYTACAGSGGGHVINGTFDDLNTTAVYFKSNPATNPNLSAVCNGTNMQLIGSYIYSGNLNPAPTPATVSYLWQLISAPAGYVFANNNTQNPVIGTLNLDGTYVFRLTVTFGGRNSFKDIQIIVGKTTTFSSSGWSDGPPNSNINATINDVYSTSVNGNFESCNCKINTGASLIINSLGYIKVQNNISNLGIFLVENDGNLLQINSGGTYSGNNITVRRNAQLKRLDYNYWGSPVSGQNFITFSPQTVATRFYTYNEVDDSFSSVPNLNANFVAAKGYAIRAPNNYTTAVQTFAGEFKGVPNNGDITIPVAYTDATKGKNMISNPYPSNLDLRLLHQKNSDLSGGVFYFWTNDANSGTGNTYTANGSYGNYSKNQYAVLNVLGATPASTPADLSPKYPSAIIKPGQGFVMQVSASGNLKFDNTMRTSATTDGSHTAVFFNRTAGKNSAVNDISGRYWLSLISPAGVKNVMLIGYVKGLVNKIDTQYNAEILSNSSDNIYSILDDKNLAIQGRNAYGIQTDVVPVGVVHYMPGTYKIQLENKDGVFNSSQDIFLRDKEINVIRNISQSPYTYDVSAAGVNNTRFEIVYQNTESVLNATNINKDVLDVVWYKSNENYVLKSNFPIDKVEVFDASGKLIWMKKEIKLKEIVIDYNNLNFGVNFIKVTGNDSVKTIKVLK